MRLERPHPMLRLPIPRPSSADGVRADVGLRHSRRSSLTRRGQCSAFPLLIILVAWTYAARALQIKCDPARTILLIAPASKRRISMNMSARGSLPRPNVLAGAVHAELVTILREGYDWADFRADAIAGLTVAIVALPLSMAIAIGSGLSPDKGLYTAIIGGFLISALGWKPDSRLEGRPARLLCSLRRSSNARAMTGSYWQLSWQD